MIRTRSQLAQSSEPPLEPSDTSLKAASSSVTTRQTFSSLPASRSVRNKPQEPSTVFNRPKETYLPVQSTNRVVQEEEDESQDDGEEMLKWGYILLVGSTLTFAVGIWSIAIGPCVDTTGLGLLDTLAKDTYYKYLVILLIPVTTCYVIINWWGLKIFRHA